MPSAPYYLGLDLGQAADYTALAVLSREPIVDDAGRPALDGRGHPLADHTVVHLERYPLNSAYPDLVEKVRTLTARPAIQARGRPRLAVDATGVGRAVVDQFVGARMEATLTPITITSGAGVTKDLWNGVGPACFRVAKADLVASVRIGLDAGRLKIVPTLPLASTLVKELQNYQLRVTRAAHETFNAREGEHDDLVLAVALAAWLADNGPPQPGASVVACRRPTHPPRVPDAPRLMPWTRMGPHGEMPIWSNW